MPLPPNGGTSTPQLPASTRVHKHNKKKQPGSTARREPGHLLRDRLPKMAGKDYGPTGCCGPSAFALLTLILGGLSALGWWLT